MFPLITYAAIGIGFFLAVVYDILIALLVGNDATISKCMQYIGRSWPIVIVAYGGLAAHFFAPKQTCICGTWVELKPYVLLCLGFFTFRLAWAQAQ